MPLLVKSSVGSLAGTSGADGTMVCPLAAKYSRNLLRMSAAFMRARSSVRSCASRSGNQRKLLTVFEFNMLAHESGPQTIRRSAQQLEYRGYRKAACLQVTYLPRLLAIVDGRLAEATLPQSNECRVVVEFCFAQGLVDVVRRDPFCLQSSGNTATTEATGFLADDRAGEALVGKQTLRAKIVQRDTDFCHVAARADKTRFQFSARVFTPREQPDRLRPERARD